MIRTFQDMKYRSKLILLCMLVGLLPLSIMGIFCYSHASSTARPGACRARSLDYFHF